MSYYDRMTSTAQMDLLVTATLPVNWDEHRAYQGHFALQLARNRPLDLLLPSRSGLRVFRRQGDGLPSGWWEAVEELSASTQPWTRFGVQSAQTYMVGFHAWWAEPGPRSRPPVEPLRPTWRQYSFRSSWSASGGWLLDWNGDGCLDWATRNGGRREGLRICLQTAQGRFDRERPVVPRWPGAAREPDVDEEEPGSRRAPSLEDSDRISADAMISFTDLADVNGDGRLDLLRISALENWAAPKTRIAVYLQRPENTFLDQPDQVLRIGALLPTDVLPLADLDGDGDLDLLLLRIDLDAASVSSNLKAFVRKGIEAYLGAYLWRGGAGYAKRPAWEKRIVIGHEMFEFSRDPRPLMQFDRDLTGDDRPDLVLRLSRETVGVFAMTDSERGFAETATATLKVPFPVEAIECGDFDGDGRNDVLIEGWDVEERDRLPRAVFFGEPTAP
ncbi:hypothetical protein AMJ85_10185 [candidate division BRC1 bacterium SM23_51]|nr:MAG: hypothetical protein AMJ85_10185 [candidate division BRC1 bacterium SM23_51]